MKWNPFALHGHNGWKLPRVLFHLSHAALGLPAAIAGFLGAPWWAVLVLVLVLCYVDKVVWLHWGPAANVTGWRVESLFTRHVTLIWHQWVVTDYVDLVSDCLLTGLGGFLYVWAFDGWRGWVGALVCLYVLGTFNGE
jgi:hypothetical protein